MEAIISHKDDILRTGTIMLQLWDEILHPDVLLAMHPTRTLAKALSAAIRGMKDQILIGTIFEYFKTHNAPKKVKAPNSKDWFDELKQDS